MLQYVDDTSVGAETEEEYMKSVNEILQILYENEVRLKHSKCYFGVREVEVLSQKVSMEGVLPSNANVSAIRNLIVPASGNDLMKFLGLMNYFSRFIDHFSDIARPLYEVLKGTGFSKKRAKKRLIISDWVKRSGQAQREAWRIRKHLLGNPSALSTPRWGAPKKVVTDACAYGVGGAPLQENDHGTWQPLPFTSRQLKKSELAYPVHQKECLAVVHALKIWMHYLHGETFQVATEQMSLKWLMSLHEPLDRLARWVL